MLQSSAKLSNFTFNIVASSDITFFTYTTALPGCVSSHCRTSGVSIKISVLSLKKASTHTREKLPPAFRLETGVKADQEGVIRGLLKDVFFCLDPVDVLEEKRTKTHPHVSQR